MSQPAYCIIYVAVGRGLITIAMRVDSATMPGI